MLKHCSDQSGLRVRVDGRYAVHGAPFPDAREHAGFDRAGIDSADALDQAERFLETDSAYGWTLGD